MNLPFYLGAVVFEADKSNAEKIINLCNENGIAYKKLELCEESIKFRVSSAQAKRARTLAKENGIELREIGKKGALALVFRLKKRAGLIVGAIIAITLLVYSSGLVWDIRIEGASNVSERDLKKVFAECGLSVGAKIKDIDCDVLENQILILSDEISWVSVNLRKNVANVEIRELDFAPPSEEDDFLYSNVVASREGVIVGFGEINGRPTVKIGDAVCKGQLLISGIEGGDGKPLRLLKASGEVFAEVEETIEIKIPQKYIKKVTKNQIKSEKSLIFFKNEIKFFSNCRNSEATCDKIEVIENLYVKDKRLPVALKTVKYIEYEESELSRTKSEMQALALRGLNQKINKDLKDAEILEKSISFIEAEDSLTLVCKIKCISNIASPRPLT